jgi:hypothetical protein
MPVKDLLASQLKGDTRRIQQACAYNIYILHDILRLINSAGRDYLNVYLLHHAFFISWNLRLAIVTTATPQTP